MHMLHHLAKASESTNHIIAATTTKKKKGRVEEQGVGEHLYQAMSTPPPLLPDAEPQEKDALNALCAVLR